MGAESTGVQTTERRSHFCERLTARLVGATGFEATSKPSRIICQEYTRCQSRTRTRGGSSAALRSITTGYPLCPSRRRPVTSRLFSAHPVKGGRDGRERPA